MTRRKPLLWHAVAIGLVVWLVLTVAAAALAPCCAGAEPCCVVAPSAHGCGACAAVPGLTAAAAPVRFAAAASVLAGRVSLPRSALPRRPWKPPD